MHAGEGPILGDFLQTKGIVAESTADFAGIYDAGLSYEQQLIAWQSKIKESCSKVPFPDHKPQETPGVFGSDSDTIKTVAIAVGVVAGAVVLLSFTKR